MAHGESLYQCYFEGRVDPPGFLSCTRAKEHLAKYILPNRERRPPLVVAYPARDDSGIRAEYYDWTFCEWKKTGLDFRGAYYLARNDARVD